MPSFILIMYAYHTLLKINENNSIWVTFNSFSLMKHSLSFWRDFSQLNDLKNVLKLLCSYLNKLKPHKNQKMYNVIFQFEFIIHIFGILSLMLCLQRPELNGNRTPLRLKQSALTIRARRRTSNQKTEKYLDWRSTLIPLVRKSWMGWILSTNCASIAQVQWNPKRLFNLTLVFLARVELKKTQLEKIELTYLF